MDLWRISKFLELDGKGGELYSARWNTRGQPVAYLAASPPGALLEVLVHLELDENLDEVPPSYTLLRIAVPNRFRVPLLTVPGRGWISNLSLTRTIGDAWLKSRKSALARVPSAILPATFNYLLNPLHPNASSISVAEVHKAVFDPRLLR